tara:strand:+ start:1659 stop:2018 length:360 start_codon:yes stop_codon:yes gene_type:complete
VFRREADNEARIATRVAQSKSAHHYSPSRPAYVQERVVYRPVQETTVVRSVSSGAPGTRTTYSPSRYARYGMGGGSFTGEASRQSYKKEYSPLRKDQIDSKSYPGKKVSFNDGEDQQKK